jgi:hypothetical protein
MGMQRRERKYPKNGVIIYSEYDKVKRPKYGLVSNKGCLEITYLEYAVEMILSHISSGVVTATPQYSSL